MYILYLYEALRKLESVWSFVYFTGKRSVLFQYTFMNVSQHPSPVFYQPKVGLKLTKLYVWVGHPPNPSQQKYAWNFQPIKRKVQREFWKIFVEEILIRCSCSEYQIWNPLSLYLDEAAPMRISRQAYRTSYWQLPPFGIASESRFNLQFPLFSGWH